MILTNHGDHLGEAFNDILGNKEIIKVICAGGAEVRLNRDLICLFSSFLREMITGISNTSSTALIVPDASAFSMEQVGKIFSTGATEAGISNYKDINEIVETGKLFKLDLSQLIFEKTEKNVPPKDQDSKVVMNTDQKFSQDTSSFSPVKSPKETACLYLKNPRKLLKTRNIKMASIYNYDLDMISDQEFCEEDDSSSKFLDYKVPNDRFFYPEPSFSNTEMLQDPSNTGHHCYQGPLPSSPTEANQGLDHYQDFTETARPENRRQMSINSKILCKNCKVYDHHKFDKLMIHYFICKRLNPFARKLVCRVCPSFKCKNPSTFHKHMRKKHWDLVKHCENCEFTTFYDGELKKHVTKFHKRAKDQSSSEFTRTSDGQDDVNICDKVKNLYGKDSENQKESSNKSVASWRKEMGWGPDDQFTCDYWNFVGKGQCRMEDGHKDDWRIIRHHACALCFRNTGQKENHPASSCQLFPLPEKDRSGGGHEEGERGPSMAQMGMARSEKNKNAL